MSRTPAALMEKLHTALALDLLKRIESGEATAADLAVLRAFLKDNGIEGIMAPGAAISRLSESVVANLPFPTEGLSH